MLLNRLTCRIVLKSSRLSGYLAVGKFSSSSSSSSHSPPSADATQRLASIDNSSRILTLHTAASSDSGLRYPMAWLRDNCQCPLCHNPHSDSRQLLMNNFLPHSRITQASVEAEHLRLVWCDGHESSYPLDWLVARSFTESGQAPRDPRLDRAQPKLWLSHPFSLEYFDYKAAMTDDAAMLRMLERLESDGLVLLDNCGTDELALSRFCRRIAYPRRTHYGITFRVESKVGPSNLAYTNAFLGLHSDLPYFRHQPDIQALHCVRQTDVSPGGENLFSDAFSAAELLRQRHPDMFDILSTARTNFRDRNSDDLDRFYLVERHPVLQLDSRGRMRCVHFSNQQRDSVLCLPIQRVQLYYEALKMFNTLLQEPSISLEHRLANGQMVVFENGRVLHARNAYKGSRLYIGAYLSWDETLSRRRVLQRLL